MKHSIFTKHAWAFMLMLIFTNCKSQETTQKNKDLTIDKNHLTASQNDIPKGACRISAKVVSSRLIEDKRQVVFNVSAIKGYGSSYSATGPNVGDTLEAFVDTEYTLTAGKSFNADILPPAETFGKKMQRVSIIHFLEDK